MPNVNKNSLTLILSAFILLLPSAARANGGGRPLVAPMDLGVGAAMFGRGTVSSGGSMDASDVYRFPVNAVLANGAQFIAGQASTVDGELSAVFAAASLPLFYRGAIGGFVRGMPSQQYETSGIFGLSFGFYDDIYAYGLGGHVGFMNSDVLGESENFASFGLDFRVDPSEDFTGRVYFLGSGVPLRSESPYGARLADQFGIAVNYHPWRGSPSVWGFDIGLGAQKTGDDPFVLGASAEVGVRRAVFARAGYEYPSGGKANVSGLSVGAGVLLWRGSVGADGAYRFGENGEGGIWAASVKVEIETLKKRNAAANFALAQSHFNNGRYGKAALYCERVIAIDTTHWNAKTLLEKAKIELGRATGNDIAIIYGGNARGIAVPYPPSPDALGGLSRYAAAVSDLRRRYPVNFSIDVGNMMSAENHEIKADMVSRYYEHMRFDAVAPGGGEIAMARDELMKMARNHSKPVVITNINDNDFAQSGISSSVLLTNDGYSVYLINLIARSAQPEGADMAIEVGSVRSMLRGQRGADADLRVAVIHGNMAEIKSLAEQLPEINVIIAGSLDEKFETPREIGNAALLSAGAGNKYAGCLTLRFSEGKYRRGRVTKRNRLHPVFQNIAPDTAVENIVRLVAADVKIVKDPDATLIPARVSGVIAHLSDRGGTRAFIKSAQNKAEYPMSGEDMPNNRRPAFSAYSNRAAMIFGKSDESDGKLRMIDLSVMNGRTVASGGNVLEAAFSPLDGFLYYIEADSGQENGAIYKTKMYMFDAMTVIERGPRARRDLSVSDDGATILFCEKDGENRWHVHAIDSSAAAPPARLTTGNADHRYPRLSPDGNFLAYLTDRDAFGGKMDLWLFERGKNGATHKRLTFNSNVRDFNWGDDSETIYFSAGANLAEINAINIREMTTVKLIPPPGTNTVKAWSENTPRFIRHNGMPKIVYTREYINGARRIYWYDIREKIDEKPYAVGEFNEWLE